MYMNIEKSGNMQIPHIAAEISAGACIYLESQKSTRGVSFFCWEHFYLDWTSLLILRLS